MNIGTHRIGVDPPYVIAEIGSNHGGSLKEARRLIGVAADCGAHAAKFQLYRADKLYPGTTTAGAIPDAWLTKLQGACITAGIDFICSVFCEETLDAYLTVDPVAVKIASPEATDETLLVAAADTGLPILVSTGAMAWPNLDRTRNILVTAEANFALLHCVSSYPTPPAEMNLRVIERMETRYGCPVGLSDHTLNAVAAPVTAVAYGASIIEKHLTPGRNLPGPDHPFAIHPHEFARMTEAIAQAWEMRGDGIKVVQPSEDATDRRAA